MRTPAALGGIDLLVAKDAAVEGGEDEGVVGLLAVEAGIRDEEQLVIAENVGLLRDFGLRRGAAFPERLARERIDADDLAAALEGNAAGRDRAGVEVQLASRVVADVAIAQE